MVNAQRYFLEKKLIIVQTLVSYDAIAQLKCFENFWRNTCQLFMKINPKGRSTFWHFDLFQAPFKCSIRFVILNPIQIFQKQKFSIFYLNSITFIFILSFWFEKSINRDPIFSTYAACKVGIAFGSFVGCCSRWALSTWSGPLAGDRQCHRQRKATQKRYQNTTSSVEWNNKRREIESVVLHN